MNRSRTPRRALASLEAVIATAITVPAVVALAVLGIRACRNFYFIVGNLIGWPYL